MAEEMYRMQEVWVRLEEGRTLYSTEKISTPRRAIEVMQRELSRYDREVVCIVNLNNASQPINFNIVSIGSLNTSIADVANILKACILSNSGSFIMIHNHPSGDPTPSMLDIETTKRLILAGQLMGIPCLDHVIIAGNREEIYSMKENRDLDFEPGYSQMMEGVAGMVSEPETAYRETSYPEMPFPGSFPEAGTPEETFGSPFDTPFGEIDPMEAEQASRGGAQKGEGQKLEEVSLHFGKGLCQLFTSKKGAELARVKIPNTPFESWPSFVVPAKLIHDNQFGKGYWMKLPADGKTSVSISRRVTLEDGSEGWQEKRITVENRQLKNMVESYKKGSRDQAAADGREDVQRPRDRGR